jgi:hypothetical protein
MITINLLPQEDKKEESSFSKFSFSFKGQEKLVKKIAITVLLALVAMHAVLFFIGMRSSMSIRALAQKDAMLQPGKKEYEALKSEVGSVNKKASAVDALIANRFSWAKKLNDLSESMTQGIWLTEISYKETPSEISTQVKALVKKPITKLETKKIIFRYLNISGYASSMGEGATALVGKFINGMKENPSFFSDFTEIKLESIKSEKIFDQEVMNFRITCLFKE